MTLSKPFGDPTTFNHPDFMKIKILFRDRAKCNLKTPLFWKPQYLSSTILDLLHKMFLFSPSERISAYEIIRHPFCMRSDFGKGLDTWTGTFV